MSRKDNPNRAGGVYFEDEFAPSSSPAIDEANSGVLQTKAGRLCCYNDHVIDFMEGALERACELGAPNLLWVFPLQYLSVSTPKFKEVAPIVRSLCTDLDEQSDDWLALKCYLCWLEACHLMTEGFPAMFVADRMFVAGATAREFELSRRNRQHSALGRKQNRHLTALREGKNDRARNAVTKRRYAVAALMRETKLTGGALDKWLVRQLKERHDITVSMRTVREDRRTFKG